MKPLAQRLARLGTENAFAVSALAQQWQAQGHRVYPFHLGDINIPPPPAMIEGVHAAIAGGKNGYAPGAGIVLLRAEIARLINTAFGIDTSSSYTETQVAVQPGGKPVIGKFLAAVMNPGDEVLFPVPGFPIYESQIQYQGGVAVPYFYRADSSGGFVLDLESLQQAITPKTTALILNNYHNPTGCVLDLATLDAVAELAHTHDLWVLSDEAYFAIQYEKGATADSIITRPNMRERCVVLFTCSKQFAMTGWRLGAALGNEDIISTIAKMNTNIESCTAHFVQHAVADALHNNAADSAPILSELACRRAALAAALNGIDGIQVSAPKSGFYIYCDVSNIMQRKKMDSVDELMRASLQASGVSFCTGEHFGERDSRNIRFAFSGVSPADIDEGVSHLKTFFEQE